MSIILLIIALFLLCFFYIRMIRREVPDPIGRKQAIVPILLGVVSLIVSFVLLLAISLLAGKLGFQINNVQNPVIRALLSAFFAAGLVEELAKLLFILLSIRIFRPKNLYEYILTGYAVGMGFALLEEFLYAGGMVTIVRLFTFALHSVFGIIMAKHLGMARYNRRNGSGSVAGETIKAIVLPMLLHTVYDACTVSNPVLQSLDTLGEQADSAEFIFLLVGIVALIGYAIWQFVVLARVKKNAEKYSSMGMFYMFE